MTTSRRLSNFSCLIPIEVARWKEAVHANQVSVQQNDIITLPSDLLLLKHAKVFHRGDLTSSANDRSVTQLESGGTKFTGAGRVLTSSVTELGSQASAGGLNWIGPWPQIDCTTTEWLPFCVAAIPQTPARAAASALSAAFKFCQTFLPFFFLHK